MSLRKKTRSFKPVLFIFLLLLVSVPLIWLAIIRLEGTPPALELSLESPYVGASRSVSVSVSDVGSGVRRIWIAVIAGDKEEILLQQSFSSAGFFAGGKEKTVSVDATISPKTLGMSDGKALLRVAAWDYSLRKWGKGNQIYLEKEIYIDTQTPSIRLISQNHNLNQGGSGLAIYRLSEACPVSGVTVGDHFYPGVGGLFRDPSIHMAFFALDYRQDKKTPMVVSAEDKAGNRSTARILHHVNGRTFRKDAINISDKFFNKKMPDFEKYFPDKAGGNQLELFLKVNREQRKKDNRAIFALTAQSEKEILWKGNFLRLPRSANRARFADQRTYFYGGKVIDRQVHMGIDLASTSGAPVPAANRGKIVFTGDIGIYGNTVIIDHGLGLFTLYAHLRHISVMDGQTVEKGDIIGNTGMTGLAGGDHLHYGTIVHQTYVNPIEWWDKAWIKNNITSKIEDAKNR